VCCRWKHFYGNIGFLWIILHVARHHQSAPLCDGRKSHHITSPSLMLLADIVLRRRVDPAQCDEARWWICPVVLRPLTDSNDWPEPGGLWAFYWCSPSVIPLMTALRSFPASWLEGKPSWVSKVRLNRVVFFRFRGHGAGLPCTHAVRRRVYPPGRMFAARTATAFGELRESQMTAGLGLCTSEDARPISPGARPGRFWAKAAWAWYSMSALGLFSAASRGTGKVRGQRVGI